MICRTQRPTARVILADPDDRVLLLRFVPPEPWPKKPAWFLPGGGIEPGETLAQAAVREAPRPWLRRSGGLRAGGVEAGQPLVGGRRAGGDPGARLPARPGRPPARPARRSPARHPGQARLLHD
ncbi:NUDIX domain-containing protein [Nonomuraea rubra]